MIEQAFTQVREVPVGIARRRDPLVHVHNVHVLPGKLLRAQCAQHQPWRVAAADRDDEATT